MAFQRSRFVALPVLATSLFLSTGCEQLFDRGSKQKMESADRKAAAGDVRGAVKLYESALDGTAKTADAHYKLALIYADKLKKPLSALHHFERYLAFEPRGNYAKEAAEYRKEGEHKLLASLTNGNPITQEEAIKIRKENLRLMDALVALRAKRNATPPPVPAGVKKGEQVQKQISAGVRTHTVKKGDTLASIAAQYYKNKARWKDIQDANFYSLEGTATIKPGMVLMIP
jgi:tetratricopeptide (TPR) repeat protein